MSDSERSAGQKPAGGGPRGGAPLDCVSLVGPPAAGKSSIGAALAKNLGFQFADIDTLIEKRHGKKVHEIIRVDGESMFRAYEALEIAELLPAQRLVLSTGAGAVIEPKTRELLARQTVPVLITSTVKTLVARAEQAELKNHQIRPLLFGATDRMALTARLEELVRQRLPYYAELAKVVIWTDYAPIYAQAVAIAEAVATAVERPVLIPVSLGQGQIQLIRIERGSAARLSDIAEGAFPRYRRFGILLDTNIGFREEYFPRERSAVIGLTGGESAKRLATVESSAEKLLEGGLGRGDVLISVGGGVTGDVGGLLASLYMRGIALMHVPTTIVSQVDSAIGGKTGVNISQGKNLLGTFHPASQVLVDVGMLRTLPERDYRSGFAEVIKAALLDSEVFLEWMEQNSAFLCERNEAALEEMVERAVLQKVKVVAADPYERTGERRVLNLGHTVGHAIEKLTDYSEFLHGEAVAIGMVVALRLGERLGVTSADECLRVEKLLGKFSLSAAVPWRVAPSGVGETLPLGQCRHTWKLALWADKKRSGKRISFVLLRRIGEPIVLSLSPDEVLDVVFSR